MDLNQDYFTLFGLTKGFDIDVAELSEHYRELARQWHPDRFADKSDREQRLAVQYTTHLNEALSTLKDPLQRAQYLLALAGRETRGDVAGKQLDGAFLMQQLMLREQLEEIPSANDPEEALDALRDNNDAAIKTALKVFVDAYEAADLDAAEEQIYKLQYMIKLGHEIDRLEEQLFDD